MGLPVKSLLSGGVFTVVAERKKKKFPPGGGGGAPPPLQVLTIDTWAPVQCISDFLQPRARELHAFLGGVRLDAV